MIFSFNLDYVDYEADITVTPGCAATGPTLDGPGDPPEPTEIEIERIWLVVKGKRTAELPQDSKEYDDAEDHLLYCGDEILEQASAEALEAENDAAEERADRRKEDF